MRSTLLAGLLLTLQSWSLALGQTLVWTGAGNGTSFSQASNWSPAVVPGPGNDCVVPIGAGDLLVDSSVSVRSLSLAKSLRFDGCATLSLSMDLELRDGAEVIAGSLGGCGALIFNGVTQSIRGRGAVSATAAAGSDPGFIRIMNGSEVTIESDVEIRLAASATTSASIRVESGRLRNAGTIVVNKASRSLSIVGNGVFENLGTLSLLDGSLIITSGCSDLGVIARTNGTVTFSGNWIGSAFAPPQNSGPINLSNATFRDVAMVSSAGTKIRIVGPVTLQNARVQGEIWIEDCGLATIEQDLIIDPDAVIAIDRYCFGYPPSRQIPLLFPPGEHHVRGGGKIDVTRNSQSRNEPVLFCATGATVYIDADATFQYRYPVAGDPPVPAIEIAAGATLRNDGTIEVLGEGVGSDIRGAGAFENSGILRVTDATLKISLTSWRNTGSLDVRGGTVRSWSALESLGAIAIHDGTFSAIGGLFVGGSLLLELQSLLEVGPGAFGLTGEAVLDGSTVNVNAPWQNTGAIIAQNSSITLNGEHASLGAVFRQGGSLTVQGTCSERVFEIPIEAGSVVLKNWSATACRVRSDGEPFLFDGVVTLNACRLETPSTLSNCGQLQIRNGITLDAALRVVRTNTLCEAGTLLFAGGDQSIEGSGILEVGAALRWIRIDGAIRVSIGAGIQVLDAGDVPTPTTFGTLATGATLISRGRLSVSRVSKTISFDGGGAFVNEGTLDVGPGTLAFSNLQGPVGRLTIRSGGAVSIGGDFRFDRDVEVPSASTLSLSGSWTNEAVLRASNATVILGGTWSNAGLFDFEAVKWTIGGTYAGLGTIAGQGNQRTYVGTYPASLLRADSSTGNVVLGNLSLTDARLEAAGGAKFVFPQNSVLTLRNTVIAANLTLGQCNRISVLGDELALDGGTIQITTPSSCAIPISFSGTTAPRINGMGQIVISGAAAGTVVSAPTASTSAFTIGAGIVLRYGPGVTATNDATISAGSGVIRNLGSIIANQPGRALLLSSRLDNQGVVEAAAGSVGSQFASAASLLNWNASDQSLNSGRWIASGGTLLFVFRSTDIRTVGPGAVIEIRSTSGALPRLASLRRIDGQLSVSSGLVSAQPDGGNLSLFGELSVDRGARFQVNGSLLMDSASVLRLSNLGADANDTARVVVSGDLFRAGTLNLSVDPFVGVESGTALRRRVTASRITGSFARTCLSSELSRFGLMDVVEADPTGDALSFVSTSAGGTSPKIIGQPADESAAAFAVFRVEAGPQDCTFTWKRGGVALVDGTAVSGAVFSGTKTSRLRIDLPTASESGTYDVEVANPCGTIVSRTAVLRLCAGDLTSDGIVDDRDFERFAAAYDTLDCGAAEMEPDCPADLDGNGSVEDADFGVFVLSYDAVLCP